MALLLLSTNNWDAVQEFQFVQNRSQENMNICMFWLGYTGSPEVIVGTGNGTIARPFFFFFLTKNSHHI